MEKNFIWSINLMSLNIFLKVTQNFIPERLFMSSYVPESVLGYNDNNPKLFSLEMSMTPECFDEGLGVIELEYPSLYVNAAKLNEDIQSNNDVILFVLEQINKSKGKPFSLYVPNNKISLIYSLFEQINALSNGINRLALIYLGFKLKNPASYTIPSGVNKDVISLIIDDKNYNMGFINQEKLFDFEEESKKSKFNFFAKLFKKEKDVNEHYSSIIKDPKSLSDLVNCSVFGHYKVQLSKLNLFEYLIDKVIERDVEIPELIDVENKVNMVKEIDYQFSNMSFNYLSLTGNKLNSNSIDDADDVVYLPIKEITYNYCVEGNNGSDENISMKVFIDKRFLPLLDTIGSEFNEEVIHLVQVNNSLKPISSELQGVLIDMHNFGDEYLKVINSNQSRELKKIKMKLGANLKRVKDLSGIVTNRSINYTYRIEHF